MRFSAPIVFEPIFMDRVWGGRRLETSFGKRLPTHGRIGESWEVVDRAEAQSVVTLGSGFNQPQGVAVDNSGNVFVADTANGAVKEILAAGGDAAIKTLGNGFGGAHDMAQPRRNRQW